MLRLERDIATYITNERRRIAALLVEIKSDMAALGKLKSERGRLTGRIINATRSIGFKRRRCRIRRGPLVLISRKKQSRRNQLKHIAIRKAQSEVARQYKKQWYENFLARPQDKPAKIARTEVPRNTL